MSMPEADLFDDRERTLIRQPKIILSVKGELGVNEDYYDHGDNSFYNIKIETNEGIYVISSCSHCPAVFWDKIHDSEGTAK